jgi:hypothetical protein
MKLRYFFVLMAAGVMLFVSDTVIAGSDAEELVAANDREATRA